MGIAFVGGRSQSIGVFRFDPRTGQLTLIETQPVPDTDPAFLAFSPDHSRLYAVDESWDGPGGMLAFDIKGKGGLTPLNKSPSDSPVHLAFDPSGRWLLAASYATGRVMSFPVDDQGRLGAQVGSAFAGEKAHQVLVLPSGRVLVPCLGSQAIAQFDFHDGMLQPSRVPQIPVRGDGPRHLARHPTKPFVYLINELSSTIEAFRLSGEGLTPIGTELSTIPEGAERKAAEVQVHPSGRFVYSSNRGDDSIAVFRVQESGELERIMMTKTGGSSPRHFSISPSGDWMLVANEGSSTLTTLRIDQDSGLLTRTPYEAPFASPQFVELLPDSSQL